MSDYWKEIAEKSTTASTPAENFLVPTNQKLIRHVNGAAGWMWTIAALSGVNLILAYVRAPIQMPLSLFVSDVVFAVGYSINPIAAAVALIVDAVLLGLLVFLGFQIKKWRTWAFIMSFSVLTLDAVLIYFTTTLAGLWPFILHGIAVCFLALGLKASNLLNRRKINGQA